MMVVPSLISRSSSRVVILTLSLPAAGLLTDALIRCPFSMPSINCIQLSNQKLTTMSH